MSRIWRDGQTRPVHIYRLVCQNVIEDAILMRQRSKEALALSVSSSGAGVPSASADQRMSLTKSDIIALIQPKFRHLLRNTAKSSDEFAMAADEDTHDNDKDDSIGRGDSGEDFMEYSGQDPVMMALVREKQRGEVVNQVLWTSRSQLFLTELSPGI